MAFQPVHFADDTDFERTVVSLLGTHRVRLPQPGTVHDIRASAGRGQIIAKLGVAEEGRGRERELRQALQPLGLAAAYKVLDQLVEHVLRGNNTSHGWGYAAKAAALATTPAILPTPLDSHPGIWDRLVALYSAFMDARHAVTHRRARATKSGDLEVHDNQGQHTDTISNAEIAAFAAAIHGLAELVIDASDDSRRVRIVSWHLNALQARHHGPPLPAINAAAGRRLLQMDLEPVAGGVRFDVRLAREVVEGQQTAFWDLELHHAAQVFEGLWDDVPDQNAPTLEFDPAMPPAWLTERV